MVLDYSRFDHIGDTSSEDEHEQRPAPLEQVVRDSRLAEHRRTHPDASLPATCGAGVADRAGFTARSSNPGAFLSPEGVLRVAFQMRVVVSGLMGSGVEELLHSKFGDQLRVDFEFFNELWPDGHGAMYLGNPRRSEGENVQQVPGSVDPKKWSWVGWSGNMKAGRLLKLGENPTDHHEVPTASPSVDERSSLLDKDSVLAHFAAGGSPSSRGTSLGQEFDLGEEGWAEGGRRSLASWKRQLAKQGTRLSRRSAHMLTTVRAIVFAVDACASPEELLLSRQMLHLLLEQPFASTPGTLSRMPPLAIVLNNSRLEKNPAKNIWGRQIEAMPSWDTFDAKVVLGLNKLQRPCKVFELATVSGVVEDGDDRDLMALSGNHKQCGYVTEVSGNDVLAPVEAWIADQTVGWDDVGL